jgi:hypothetical protein
MIKLTDQPIVRHTITAMDQHAASPHVNQSAPAFPRHGNNRSTGSCHRRNSAEGH